MELAMEIKAATHHGVLAEGAAPFLRNRNIVPNETKNEIVAASPIETQAFTTRGDQKQDSCPHPLLASFPAIGILTLPLGREVAREEPRGA